MSESLRPSAEVLVQFICGIALADSGNARAETVANRIKVVRKDIGHNRFAGVGRVGAKVAIRTSHLRAFIVFERIKAGLRKGGTRLRAIRAPPNRIVAVSVGRVAAVLHLRL